MSEESNVMVDEKKMKNDQTDSDTEMTCKTCKVSTLHQSCPNKSPIHQKEYPSHS